MSLRRSFLLWALLMVPLAAQAFPIEIKLRSEGLDIDTIPMQVHWGAIVRVKNNELLAIRCNARFVNGPEERRRVATIPPGDIVPMRYNSQREILRLRVFLDCVPVPE